MSSEDQKGIRPVTEVDIVEAELGLSAPDGADVLVTQRSLFIFRVGATWLAVDPEAVESVVDDQAVAPIPLAPAHVPGVVNVDDRLVPVLSLQRFLSLDERSGGDVLVEYPRLVVIRAGGMTAAIKAGRAVGVAEVLTSDLGPVSALAGTRLDGYLTHEYTGPMGAVGVLDPARLLRDAVVR